MRFVHRNKLPRVRRGLSLAEQRKRASAKGLTAMPTPIPAALRLNCDDRRISSLITYQCKGSMKE